MKKIIHLSDLHVGHEECSDKFRALIDNITFLKQPADNYVIVITGDIVDNATVSEQTDEAVAGIRQLEERGYRVLVIPGNHDYGTGTRTYANSVISFKEKYYGSRRIT
ncbi:MAG TPA: metallophosphoesterase [Bacteroidales bacterium]|nr:metallophosphoesterase [Bacteroidales bacterium]